MDDPGDFGMATLVCHTEGCENEGIALIVPVSLPDPIAVCGPCGQWITSIDIIADPNEA